jgi:hypothetical protein
MTLGFLGIKLKSLFPTTEKKHFHIIQKNNHQKEHNQHIEEFHEITVIGIIRRIAFNGRSEHSKDSTA